MNAGAPVLMPWRDEVAAILWAWLTVTGNTAEVTVRNTGERPGREVVQLYASTGGTVRLAGFAVAEAAPGESATVRVRLDERVLRTGGDDLEISTTRADIG